MICINFESDDAWQILNQLYLFVMLQIQIINLYLLGRMQMRHEPLLKQRQSSVQRECNFFKYMLGKQQIQQMSLPDEENAIVIFYKLKNIFFDQNQDDEHIINVIRQDPIKAVGNMLYELTKSYNQKLNEIIEPLQDEKKHLLEKLKQTRQQLQHSMDDNQFFKVQIDQLEDQKKQSQAKLNESIDHFERSREEIINQINQREKIRNEVMKIYIDAQEIFIQNSQLKHSIAEFEKQVNTLKEENAKIKDDNNEIININREIASKYHNVIKSQTTFSDEIEDLQSKLRDKEEFIASFIDEYNKVHFFNQHDSPGRDFTDLEKIEDEENQLKDFNFNNYDKNSNISEKSLSKNGSLRNLENQIDEKFQFINATAEKLKPKIPMSHPCVTEQKASKKVESKVSSKQKNIYSKNKYASNKVEIKQQKSSNKRVNKTLIKTVSSKDFMQKESNMLANSSEGDESKMMEQMLKKKLVEKNQKIVRLQSEITNLKDSFMEQRQKITIMEGQYELQIEQLKDQLIFTKKQLAKIYQKYTITNAESLAYQEKVAQLEVELGTIEQQHRIYCEQLKMRCKAYVLKKIDQVEYQYESIKRSISHGSAKCSHKSEYNEQLQYSHQSQQELPEQFHLQFRETPAQKQQDNCKIDSFSQIQSYERLSNHYLNGFDLEFSTKLSNMQKNHEEIYIQQQFEIQSNLGHFTERLVNNQKEEIERVRKGNFTDRYNKHNIEVYPQQINGRGNHGLSISLKVIDENICISKQRKLSLVCAHNQHKISPKVNHFGMFKAVQLQYIPQLTSNQLEFSCNIWSFTSQPKKQPQFSIFNSEIMFTFTPSKPTVFSINSQIIALSYSPLIKEFIYSTVISQQYIPTKRKLDFSYNLYQLSRAEKMTPRLSYHSISNFTIEMKKKRNIQMISSQINIHQEVKQTRKGYQLCPFQSIHVQKDIQNLKITQMRCLFENKLIGKYFKQQHCQTVSAENCQKYSQALVESAQMQIQTENINYDSQSQASFYGEQRCSQTEYNASCSSVQTESSQTIVSSQIQTEQITQQTHHTQTDGKQFIQVESQTETHGNKFKIMKQIDIKISNQYLQQQLPVDFIKIASFQIQTDQINYLSKQSSTVTPSTICTTNYKNDSFFKSNYKHDGMIHQQDFYELQEKQFGLGYNNQEESEDQIVSEKQIKMADQNLSTKNDEVIQSKVDHDLLLDKYLKLQQRDDEQYAAEYTSYEKKSQQTPRFTEQDMSSENSLLNNAVLLSESSLKDEGKTYNPQSKSYKTHRQSTSQISISPWFLDQIKQQKQDSSQKKSNIPPQLYQHLSIQCKNNLEKYLQKSKQKLKFTQLVQKKQFNKPKDLKKRIHFMFVKTDSQSDVFMITTSHIYNLRSNKYIKLQSNHRISEANFIFGQSEVVVTADSHLIIHREGKYKKLAGKLEDGVWPIQFYITCAY